MPSEPGLAAADAGGGQPEHDDRPTVLVTTVDIGGGRSDRIEIRKGDDPADAARKFCEQHQLPNAVLEPLTQHLLDNLRKTTPSTPIKQTADEFPAQSSDAIIAAAAAAAAAAAQSMPSPDHSTLLPVHEPDSPRLGGAKSQPGSRSQAAAMPPGPLPASSQDIAFTSAAQSMDVTSHQQQYHQQYQQQQQQQQQFLVGQGSANSGSRPQAPLSFAQPDDWLMQQLSNKLVPVDSKMLTVSSDDSKGSGYGKRGSARRGSQSADPSPRDSVHFRLYNKAIDQQKRAEAKRQLQNVEVSASLQASKTRMSWISAEMMRGRTHGPFDNYGEMLYAEGLESAAVRRSKADAIKSEQAQKELDGVTFTPEITALARALCGGGENDGAPPAWQRLSTQKKAKTLERLQEMKTMREQAEVKECTFKPQIDARSKALMAERAEMLRSLQMSAHEQLFQDAIRRQQKMEELSNWVPDEVTFKPQVNKSSMAQEYLRRSYEDPSAGGISASLSDDLYSGLLDGEVPAVVQRLYARHAKTQAKLEAVRAKYTGPVDPETGQPLYRPKVGRAPRNCARPSAADPQAVYDQLYANALELQSKRQQTLQEERKQAEAEASAAHATTTSQRLFERLKAKRFSQIFAYLDADRAGAIDLVAMVRTPSPRVEELDSEVREDVELAAELHAHQHGAGVGEGKEGSDGGPEGAGAPAVGAEQFEALMEAALKLRRGPRSYLVPSPSAKAQVQPSFRPAINQRSREMAARLRPPEADTYELLHGTADAVRQKLEASRKAAEDEALRECTFVPLLNANSLATEGRALRAAWQQAYPGGSGASTPRSSTAALSPAAAAAAVAGGVSPRGPPPAAAGARPTSAQQHGARASGAFSTGRRLAPGTQGPALAAAATAGASQALAGGEADVAKLLALEQEVRAALQSVSLTTQHLDASAAAHGGADPRSTSVGHAGLPVGGSGGEVGAGYPAAAGVPSVDAADLRATEAMLLDLLGPQAAAEASFQQKLAAALGVAPPPTSPLMSSYAPGAGVASYGKDTNGSSQGAVNMYVVHDAQAAAGVSAASRLENLARELNC